ncbi:MAG: hypothetical protein HC821_05045 [Lewinella sp.]|nr:hypothetical protein [Lewinella sp.]
MLTENKFSKYMLYAIGEIVLVVIGILIALQINNMNDAKNTRIKEISYLENIKNDLVITNLEIDQFIITRSESANAANNIISHYNGKIVTDWNEFNKNTVDVYTWQNLSNR